MKAPYDDKAFESAMKTAHNYKSAGNMMWDNFLYSACPGIPINAKAIDELLSTTVATPVRIPGTPGTLVIAVADDNYKPMTHIGALQSVSAEDLRSTYYLAVARDIEDKKCSKETTEQWHTYILSCPSEFEKLVSEDVCVGIPVSSSMAMRY